MHWASRPARRLPAARSSSHVSAPTVRGGGAFVSALPQHHTPFPGVTHGFAAESVCEPGKTGVGPRCAQLRAYPQDRPGTRTDDIRPAASTARCRSGLTHHSTFRGLQRGAADHQLQRQCRTGAWRRIRPGRYASADAFDALDTHERHRLRAVETLRAASADAVLSHQSAAVVHGLDLWNTPLSVTHLTRNRPTGGRRTRHRHVHSAVLRPEEIADVDGLPVTTVARTVADLARTLPFEQAVVAGDHALHAAGLTSEDVAAAANALPPHAGRQRVHRILAQLDGRSESVGESRSRVLMLREQLPVPECQPNLYSADGDHLGRVDFLFEECAVVGEFDGRGKYGRLVPDGQVPADVVWAERFARTPSGTPAGRWRGGPGRARGPRRGGPSDPRRRSPGPALTATHWTRRTHAEALTGSHTSCPHHTPLHHRMHV